MGSTIETPKGLVLVTRANGFLVARITKALLRQGSSVRGTVRASKSGASLLSALSAYTAPESVPRFELALFPGITVPSAFKESLKGATAVVHIAGACSLFNDDVDYVMNMATGDLKIVVESAAEEASVGSFVYLSSIAAAFDFQPVGRYTEENWTNDAVAIVAAKGSTTGGDVAYSASKDAAERAFWDFVQERKPAFTATASNPT